MKKFVGVGIVAALVSGCTTQTRILSDAESKEMIAVVLDDNDFQVAASDMLNDVVTRKFSGKNNGKPWQVYITNVRNETMQRINTADLTDYIENELINSGTVLTTRAFGDNKSVAIAESRELVNSALVDKSTVKKNGTVKAYDYTLEGRISQKDILVDGGKKIEYKFSLDLIDMDSGNKVWGNVKNITKFADKKAQTW
ncbi:MAG: penicillin-binding protein activator LpoB [Alphaproteobacteria bacterium]